MLIYKIQVLIECTYVGVGRHLYNLTFCLGELYLIFFQFYCSSEHICIHLLLRFVSVMFSFLLMSSIYGWLSFG